MNCSGVGALPYFCDQQITDILARSVVSSHLMVAQYGKVLWLPLYIGLNGGCRRFKTLSDLRNMNSACFYMILPSHAGFKFWGAQGFLHTLTQCWKEVFSIGQGCNDCSGNSQICFSCQTVYSAISIHWPQVFQKTACVCYCSGSISPVPLGELRLLEVAGSFLALLDKEAKCYAENMGDDRHGKEKRLKKMNVSLGNCLLSLPLPQS